MLKLYLLVALLKPDINYNTDSLVFKKTDSYTFHFGQQVDYDVCELFYEVVGIDKRETSLCELKIYDRYGDLIYHEKLKPGTVYLNNTTKDKVRLYSTATIVIFSEKERHVFQINTDEVCSGFER